MIRINSTENFENVIRNIESSKVRIKEIFEKTTGNMETINDTDIWTGLAQKEFSSKYKELSNNYGAIENSLNIYISLMRKTVDEYKAQEMQRRSDIDRNEIQLDVNS